MRKMLERSTESTPRWQRVTLAELGEISGGGTPPTKVAAYWGGDIPWLTPSEVARNQGLFIGATERRITEDGLANSAARLLPVGTVMMTSRATIGEVVVNAVPMATNQGFINIVCDVEKVDSQFMAYWIRQNKQVFIDRAHGVTFREITKANFKSIPVTLPPLSEQRAIARTLRVVEHTIQARRREVALERERKAALMQHLFTCGTRNEPRKQTEIGEMPQSWQVVPFSQLVDIAQGQVDPRVEPYASMLHVGPDNIEPRTGRLVSPKTACELNLISGKYLFGTQHVLYSKIRPYLVKAALPTFEGICSADMYPLLPRPQRLVREFLFQYLLTEQFTRNAAAVQDRTGIPKINRNQLAAIPLPEPSIPEQREIVDLLTACDAKVVVLEREIAVLEELFRAMLEELMTGRLSTLSLLEADGHP